MASTRCESCGNKLVLVRTGVTACECGIHAGRSQMAMKGFEEEVRALLNAAGGVKALREKDKAEEKRKREESKVERRRKLAGAHSAGTQRGQERPNIKGDDLGPWQLLEASE